MEVQPQLVLLQKTLLNIEGLGRQLYPDLDLWETAHPFLERWLKNRYHPKTLYKAFKRSAPEWLEKLPEIPATLLHNLETIEKMGELAPQIEQAAQDYQQAKQSHRRRHKRVLLALGLGIAAVITSLPSVSDTLTALAPLSIGLAIAGLGLYLWR